MHLPLEKNRNFSNGHQTTSVLIYTEVSKLVTKGTGDILRHCLYVERVKKVCLSTTIPGKKFELTSVIMCLYQ